MEINQIDERSEKILNDETENTNDESRPKKRKKRRTNIELGHVSKWSKKGPLVNKSLGDEYYTDIFKVTLSDKPVFNENKKIWEKQKTYHCI